MADDAYTLADFESRAENPFLKGVIKTWRKKAPIMERLPWKPNNGLDIRMIRTKTLPTVSWVKLGEALPAMKGTTEPYRERIYKMGGKIDLPREYDKINTVAGNERANQEEMAIEAMAYAFNDAFVNGDPESDPDSLIGLFWRFNNLINDSQTVLGGGYDISKDTAQSEWYFGIIDKLEELRGQLEDGDCDAFLLDDIAHWRVEAALRRSGLLSFSTDQVGRRFMQWGQGGPIFIPTGKKGDQSTDIIGHTELDDGTAKTGGDATSIYALKFGDPYLGGFYFGDIRSEDKGELEDGVNVRTVIDWTPGMYHVHPRGMARLVGIVAK